MDEKNQWGSKIKNNTKLQKKKHSATPASSTLRRQRFLDVLTINQQANVALFGTSRSMLHQSRANLPRIMWRFLFNFHTFLGKSLSSYHLRQGKGPARLQFLHATKRQKKNENRPVRDESCSIAQTHGCAKRCILCFFSCVFFSRVWKNQWARVTRNKEKTRRGLSDQKVRKTVASIDPTFIVKTAITAQVCKKPPHATSASTRLTWIIVE